MDPHLIDGSLQVILRGSWRYLSYDDLVNFCALNKEYCSIFQDNRTWIYLIKRDYNLELVSNPIYYYILNCEKTQNPQHHFRLNKERVHNPRRYYTFRHLVKQDYNIDWKYDEDPHEYYQLRYLLNIPFGIPNGCTSPDKCCYCSPNKYDLIAKKQHGICHICQRSEIDKYDLRILTKLQEAALEQPNGSVIYSSFSRGKDSFVLHGANIYDIIYQVIAKMIYPTLQEHKISLVSHLCSEVENDICNLNIKSWFDVLEHFNSKSCINDLKGDIYINKTLSVIVKRPMQRKND